MAKSDETKADEAAPAPKAAEPKVSEPATGMAYIGTLVPPGSLQGGKPATAALPLVVRDASTKRIVGIVVVSDPSWVGPTLDAYLKQAGYKGSFEHVSPGVLDAPARAEAARAILGQVDATLDKTGTLAAFGYKASMLGL